MRETSELYRTLVSNINHSFESKLIISSQSDSESSESKHEIDKSNLYSINTKLNVFSSNKFSIGNCVSGQIKIVMKYPPFQIQSASKLVPYVRVTNGIESSEWIKKGEFFIDTRKADPVEFINRKLTLTGYDAMLRAEQDYSSSTLSWPALDVDVVLEIAKAMNVNLETNTLNKLNKRYRINVPFEYTCRETLSYIAIMYGGWWIINDLGELRLITVSDIPKDTRLLVDNQGNRITFGGVRIRV